MIAKEYLHNNSSSGLPSGQKRVVNDWSRKGKKRTNQNSLRDELKAIMPMFQDGGSVDWSKIPTDWEKKGNTNMDITSLMKYGNGGKNEPEQIPYGTAVRLLSNLENPRRVGLKNGRYWPYSDGSQAFGLGTDILTNDTGRKLAQKARKEGIPAQQAHDIAVTELRKHDKAIMDSLEEEGYTTRPDTISLGPRLLAAQARYQRGNIKPIFKEWARAVIKGDGKKQKEIIGRYVKGQDRKNKVSTFDVYYGGWRTADDRKGLKRK